MKPLGKMTRFYRNQAVLNEFFAVGGLEYGGGLMEPPPFLLGADIDFPYQRRGPGKEILFADHLTVVRFLGGIRPDRVVKLQERVSCDLAERGDDGILRTRFDRLDWFTPFAELYGKELTIVLDNIPSAFAKEEKIDDYGQFSPPADYEEWRSFLQSLCRELAGRYGFQTVNAWRFRLATEERIDMDTAGFCKHYEVTTRTILETLPGARFSAYNTACVHDTERHDINAYEVARYCSRNGLPFDFAPVSFYSVPLFTEPARRHPMVVASEADEEDKLCCWTVSPLKRVEEDYHHYWSQLDLALGNRSQTPREIQELGILADEFGSATSEPGARGAAWLFQLLFHMKEVNGIDRAWHWMTMEVLHTPGSNIDAERRLLRSNGWLFAVLDHTAGAEVYVLEPETNAPDNRYVTRKAVLFADADNGKSYVVASLFGMMRDQAAEERLVLRLPRAIVGNDLAIRATHLDNETDVYRQIRDDLEEWGELDEHFRGRPNLISTISGYKQPTRGMTDDVGVQRVVANWPKYEGMMKNSLRLKPFAGEHITEQDAHLLEFALRAPSTIILELENAS